MSHLADRLLSVFLPEITAEARATYWENACFVCPPDPRIKKRCYRWCDQNGCGEWGLCTGCGTC